MKIAIVCRGSMNFLDPLIMDWDSKGYQIVETIKEADVIWSEWANDNSILSTLETNRRNVIIRLHGSEYFQNFYIRWNKSNVFAVIKANPQYKIEGVNCVNCGIPIDCDFWESRGKVNNTNRLLVVGSFVYSKNHIGLLNMLSQKPDYFKEILFVGDILAGDDPYRMVETNKVISQIEYFKNTYDMPIKIIDKQSPDQLKEIYRNSDFIVSNSINEGFHQTICEGVMSGCYPLIYDWMGSKDIYPLGDKVSYPNSIKFWDNIFYAYSKDAYNDIGRFQKIIKNLYSKELILNKIDSILFEAARGSM